MSGAATGIIFLVVVISIGPLGGWYFGRGKGWALEGALIGLFLSFVGWLIVAIIPPKGGWPRTSAPRRR